MDEGGNIVFNAFHDFTLSFQFSQSSILSTLNIQIFRMNVCFGSFYYVHVTRKAAQMTFLWKTRAFYVDEIDTRSG